MVYEFKLKALMGSEVKKYPLRYIQNTAYEVESPTGLFKSWSSVQHYINRRGKHIGLRAYNEENSQYYKNLISFLNSEILYDISDYKNFLTSQRGKEIFSLFFIHDIKDVSNFESSGRIVTKSRGGWPWGVNYAETISITASGHYSYRNSPYYQYRFFADNAILIAQMWQGPERKYSLTSKEYELITGAIKIALLFELDRDRSLELNIFITDSHIEDMLKFAVNNHCIRQ